MLLYLGYFYYQKKHIPTRSTKFFNHLYVAALINLIFDGVTLYTVNHLSSVPSWLNTSAHIIFLLSIDFIVYFLFRYVVTFSETEHILGKHFNNVTFAPMLLAICGSLFFPLYYNTSGSIAYSYGPKAYVLFTVIAFYIALIIFYTIKNWTHIEREKRTAILASMLILILVYIIQFFIPETLLSALAITIIVTSLQVTNEHPAEYLSHNDITFNKHAFEVVTKELYFENKQFQVLLIEIAELTVASDMVSFPSLQDDIADNIYQYIYKKYKLHTYKITDNCLCILIHSEKQAPIIQTDIEEHLANRWMVEHTFLNIHFNTKLFSCPTECMNHADLMQQSIHFILQSANKNAYIDSLTGVKNRNAYQKDLEELFINPDNIPESLRCILIDDNNLKNINDNLGHTFGDQFIVGTASILEKAVGNFGSIYRIGGDEFVIVTTVETEEEFMHILDQIKHYTCAYNQDKELDLNIEFAIGYAKYNPLYDLKWGDLFARADQMMYQNKKTMKQEV